MDIINPQKQLPGFYFVTDNDELKLKMLAQLLRGENAAKIQLKWRAVPFLSVKDTISLANKQAVDLGDYMDDLLLDKNFLTKKAVELTPFEEIKIQLLLALLQKKKILILENVSSNLKTLEIQELLPICEQLAKQFSLRIYLVSNDTKLAQTPYLQNDTTFEQ